MAIVTPAHTWTFAATNDSVTADNIVTLHSDDDNVVLAMDFTNLLNKSTDLSTLDAVAATGLTFGSTTLSGDRKQAQADITAGLAAGSNYTVAWTVTDTAGQTLKRNGTLYCRDS